MRTLMLTGSTGLIGETFIKLFELPRHAKLVILARRPPVFDIPNGVEIRIVSDFQDKESLRLAMVGGDEMICCIGTTIKKAGGKDEFARIDIGIVEQLAEICSEFGYAGFHYVSSIDASINSKTFYLQCKGKVEQFIQSKTFKRITILQPSLLLGPRREFRLGEKIGKMLSMIFPFVLIGRFKAYRPIKAETVARCLLYRAMSDNEDSLTLKSEEIKEFTTLTINF